MSAFISVLSIAGCLMYGRKEWVPLKLDNEDSTAHTLRVTASIPSETYTTTEDVQSRESTTINEFVPYSDTDYTPSITISVDGRKITQTEVLVDIAVDHFEVLVTNEDSAEIKRIDNEDFQ